MSELSVTTTDDADWATAWRDGYEPIRIGRLTIVPSWLEVPKGADLVIRLDPGMAFGTGLHPTTRACLGAPGVRADAEEGPRRGNRVGHPRPRRLWHWGRIG